MNQESVAMTPSHKPSMNLRFVMRDGKRILQQMFLPNDWSTHDEEWRDVPLAESPPQTTERKP